MAEPRRVCVVGGTRFVGRLLVERLLADGHEVTVVSRGFAPVPGRVRHLPADASDAGALSAAVAGHRFDAVVHQVAYTPVAALAAARAFAGRAGRFVLTSSMEVYNADTFRDPRRPAPSMSAFAHEAQLDTEAYGADLELPWHDDGFTDANYGEAKRQAESALLERADAPVAIARVAHVLSATADFTGRVDQHLRHVVDGVPLTSFRSPGRTSLVEAGDVARALAWLATSEVTGAVNVASPDPVTCLDVIEAFADAAGRAATVEQVDEPVRDEHFSAYSCPQDFGVDVSRAAAVGFRAEPALTWLPRLARRAVAADRAPQHPDEAVARVS